MSEMRVSRSAAIRRRFMGVFLICCGVAMIAAAGLLSINNIVENDYAGKESEQLREELEEVVESRTAVEQFLEDIPAGEMKVETIRDNNLIGVITIPSIGISLPVMNEWSYPNLRKTACRYSGTVEDGNLIVLAHNYSYHFGRLKELAAGDVIEFVDNFGQAQLYTVQERETLGGYELNALTDTDYDLTLFTCTYGGASRVVVRCMKEEINSIESD